MDREKADHVFDMLRKLGMSKNPSKIIALLDQVEYCDAAQISYLLGMVSNRVNSTLKQLMSEGFVQRMEIRNLANSRKYKYVYRLRVKLPEITGKLEIMNRSVIINNFDN
jgi:predicted transcriptional regulator